MVLTKEVEVWLESDVRKNDADLARPSKAIPQDVLDLKERLRAPRRYKVGVCASTAVTGSYVVCNFRPKQKTRREPSLAK